MTRFTLALGWVTAIASAAATGCAVGEGEGSVKSDRLFVEGCWNGTFDLKPDFFAANPDNQGDSLMLRLQRGDNIEEQSDGLLILVNQLSRVRKQLSDSGTGETTLKLGLPPGVRPPGVPVMANPDPPLVSLSLYLNKSCHAQNTTVYSTSGSITFRSLFSGDPQESSADARLTDASFDATVADPRLLAPSSTHAPPDGVEVESHIAGDFRFYYQRGQPAQPFQ
ncbi:MAG TPA: hypothetical protein VFQ35_06970 [Polyangiaceae bacterium]|nr:hypothetical protein [Polyangiaceae bacterium]